jgi:L-2,4-diaminobutyrate decarboxylase
VSANTGLAGGITGPDQLRPLVAAALDGLAKGAVERNGPLPGGGPDAVRRLMGSAGVLLPDDGVGATQALAELARTFAAGAADAADPSCAAHLHAPPLAVAVAADLVANTLNSSLDSWDQAPSGTVLESAVVRLVADLVGYGPQATGAVTSGGTESNLTALLLARDRAPGAQQQVFCSVDAHFSVARATEVLGMGECAVVPVPVDAQHRMDIAELRDRISSARERGATPVAVVATAGTTDLGAIDPLAEIADIAAASGVWMHVDAAYGGGALFSDHLAALLCGIDRADSVAFDLHKYGWQPVAAGVVLARDAAGFAPLERRVAYLNPEDDELAGYQGLLGRSLRTTRRVDAFKIAVTLRALGRRGMGELVDRCHDLARLAAASIAVNPRLELYQDPVLSTVVFRFLPRRGDPDLVNARLRRALLAAGRAVVGRTEIHAAVYLKLTLLNPNATGADIDALLADVVAAGEKETPA